MTHGTRKMWRIWNSFTKVRWTRVTIAWDSQRQPRTWNPRLRCNQSSNSSYQSNNLPQVNSLSRKRKRGKTSTTLSTHSRGKKSFSCKTTFEASILRGRNWFSWTFRRKRLTLWGWSRGFLLGRKFTGLRWSSTRNCRRWEQKWRRSCKNSAFKNWDEILKKKGGCRTANSRTTNGLMTRESSLSTTDWRKISARSDRKATFTIPLKGSSCIGITA